MGQTQHLVGKRQIAVSTLMAEDRKALRPVAAPVERRGQRPQAAEQSILSQFFLLLTDYASKQGLSEQQLCTVGGIDPAQIARPDRRLPMSAFKRMLQFASEQLDDPDLGLNVGRTMRPGHCGPFGLSLLACRSAAEVWRRCEQWTELVHDHHRCEVRLENLEYVIYWHCTRRDDPPHRLLEDLTAACWVSMARWLCEPSPTWINWMAFRYPRPASIAAHEELFRCPIRFGDSLHAVAVDRQFAELRMPQGDISLLRVMDAVCRRLSPFGRPRSHGPAWLDASRAALRGALGRADLRLDTVASQLGLSAAALRKRLSSVGLTFRELIDEVRREQAMCYVDDPSLGLDEIADRLGFSQQSAFQRAFKRWTGRTPGEQRRLA